MEINTKYYSIDYDVETTTLNWKGSLRLREINEYASIVHLFDTVIEQQPSQVTFNLRQLKFLNSSGINLLSRFVIKAREKNNIQLIVQGSQDIPWQGKSLKNLKRLMPDLQLEWE